MKIGTYEIMETRTTGNVIVSLGYCENEPCPYGTWIKPNSPKIKGYGNGHYFETEEEAQKDFMER